MYFRIKAVIRGYLFNLLKFSLKRVYIFDNVKILYLNRINLDYKSTIGFNSIINADGQYFKLGKESILQHNSVVELFNGFLNIGNRVSIGVGSFLSCNGGCILEISHGLDLE